MQTTVSLPKSGAHKGPDPGIVALVHVVLFMSSLVFLVVLTRGQGLPDPFGPLEKSQEALQRFAGVIKLTAFLQFGAAIPLGIFTASLTSRLNFLGVRVAGVNIALFGGLTASIFLTLSGLTGWILSQPGVGADANLMHVLQLFGFSTGGVAHVVALGFLMAGISVPCLLADLMPRWIAWLGIILAVIAELATFSLVFYPASFLIPVARFGFFVWMISSGFTMAGSKEMQ
jgi:hypothetical protein